MANGENELRSIAWTHVFPFLRLFRTFKLAVAPSRLLLGLACVLGCYVGGRVLDGIWGSCGAVLVDPNTGQTEIDAYALGNTRQFESWKDRAARARKRLAADAMVKLKLVRLEAEAQRHLATRPAEELLETEAHERRVVELLDYVAQRLPERLAAVEKNPDWTEARREEEARKLKEAADCLRLVLAGKPAFGPVEYPPVEVAFNRLAAGDEGLEPAAQQEMLNVLAAQEALNALAEARGRGPFISLLDFETRCFAGAIRGVCTFRWGFGDGPLDREPSLLGSIVSAGRGVAWLVTQRPGYALLYAILHFVVFAFFGGALCRHAAVQATREESVSLGHCWRFAREKFGGLVLAPAVPAAVFLAAAVAMWLGGILGAIPYVGELLAGVFYGLTLLGGFALAMILIATVFGLHLMWPTIAVEGSDAFDAVTHAVGYVGQRPWRTGFYSLLLLLYGAVAFVMVRLIAMLTLKLAHLFAGAGMSLCGLVSSARTETVHKLDAMWHMPAWGDLPLLPATGGTPFWGTFFNAPLNATESLGAFLIACWVFLLVSLVGAFVVSFFFCGSTQMYLLLRRDVDAVDYEEIFYEEPEETAPAGSTAPETPAGGGEPPAGSGGPSQEKPAEAPAEDDAEKP